MAINPASSLVNSVASSASSGVNPRTWGFTETLRGAMEQSEQAQGTADTQVGELMQGGGMDVAYGDDRGGEGRLILPAHDAGAQQNRRRLQGNFGMQL